MTHKEIRHVQLHRVRNLILCPARELPIWPSLDLMWLTSPYGILHKLHVVGQTDRFLLQDKRPCNVENLTMSQRLARAGELWSLPQGPAPSRIPHAPASNNRPIVWPHADCHHNSVSK